MFVSYGLIFFLMPPFCLIWIAWLLGITFAAVYAGKRLLRIGRDDVLHPRGSLLPLVLPLWGLSVAALLVSFIVTVAVSFAWPWLSTVHSEWGIAYEQAWGQAAVYVGVWSLLDFSLLLLITRRLFARRIASKTKARKLYLLHAAAAALCWDLLASALMILV